MGSFLKAQSSGGDEGQDVIEEAASSIVSGLSNILGAASVTAFSVVNETQHDNDSVVQQVTRSPDHLEQDYWYCITF